MDPSERVHFDASCNLGFATAAAFYCAFGAIGYYFYGNCTADAFTLNLMDSSAALGGLATCGVLLSTFTSISVLCMPVVRIVHEAVDGVRAALAPRLVPKQPPPQQPQLSSAPAVRVVVHDAALVRANEQLDEALEALQAYSSRGSPPLTVDVSSRGSPPPAVGVAIEVRASLEEGLGASRK
eukprot:6117300-Prymnesium_polylepis.1